MTVDFLKEHGLILFETIAGSRAYGTNLPHSDTDIRGVFILPSDYILTKYGMKHGIDQVNNSTNDITYYELGKFLKLVETNNPNILEILNSPEDCIQFEHPLWKQIIEHKDKFVTKLCRKSFGGYALQQIKKASGLNKKVFNVVEKEKKDILDFCYAIENYDLAIGGFKGFLLKLFLGSDSPKLKRLSSRTVPIKNFLKSRGLEQKFCGVVKLPHARDNFSVFYDYTSHCCFADNVHEDDRKRNKKIIKKKKLKFLKYKGLCLDDNTSDEIRLSSVPKEETPICNLIYNKDDYTIYCNEYTAYWNWVADRNPDRYEETIKHGQAFDGKNMMHTIRLLDVAIDIAQGKGIVVRRPNREELLDIRRGKRTYDDLMAEADSKMKLIDELFENSDLPDVVDSDLINSLILKIRKQFYNL